MIDVEQLKRQHAEIDEVMAGAMEVIDAGEVSSKTTVLTAMLADISRLIGSHLAIEDSEVYPILVESMDPDVSRTARQFRDNMSGSPRNCRDTPRDTSDRRTLPEILRASAMKRAGYSNGYAIGCGVRKTIFILYSSIGSPQRRRRAHEASVGEFYAPAAMVGGASASRRCGSAM